MTFMELLNATAILQELGHLKNQVESFQTKMSDLDDLYVVIQDLRTRVNDLEISNKDLTDKLTEKKLTESFYQDYLENKFKATHSKTTHGITDLELDDKIIEVKEWKHYKHCLGQLLGYTHENKKQGCAYFYDRKPKKLKDVLQLFESYKINVYHLENVNGRVVEEVLFEVQQPTSSQLDEIEEWCKNNIVQKDGCTLQLTELCVAYFKGNITNNKQKSNLKKQIESYLAKHYSNIISTCKVYTINGYTCQCWKGFCLKLSLQMM